MDTSSPSTTYHIDMALKEIAISDFKGGRTNFVDQALIEQNTCASGSMNVWAPEGGLTKAPGWVLQSSFTASGGANCVGFWADDTVSTANFIFYRISLTSTGGDINTEWYPFGGGTTLADALNVLAYTTGTISISGANRVSATGSGTSWTTHVSTGDRLQVNVSGSGWYQVKSVEDNTHLTLNSAVPAAVATGSAYQIQLGLINQEIAMASLNGSLMWTTTGDTMQRYDGTGMTRVSAGPKAAYLTVFKNYMFAARTSTAESRVYWSTIKDPTTWPANNFIDVNVLNGKISGLHAYGSELIVFKTRGLYKIIGDVFDPSNPQYYVLKISTPLDFMFNSNYSVATYQGILIFYGGGRIYQYRLGTLFITDISHTIIRDLPTAFGVLFDAQSNVDQRIQGVAFNDFYILKGLQDPNNGSRNMGLILDRNWKWWYLTNRNGQTTTVDPLGQGKMTVIPNTTTRPRLAIAMDTYGKVFTWDFVGPGFGTSYYDQASSGSSTSVAINGTWISKEFNIEYGVFKWIIIYLQKQSAGNLTVQWSIDQAANVSYTLDMTKGRGQIIRAVIPVQQKGSTIQLTLSNNTDAQTFKIYAIKIVYEESLLERPL